MFSEHADMISERLLRLPKTFKKIDLQSTRDKQLKSYLEKRKITQDIIDFYNIGVTQWDGEDYTWRNRIIIPSYDSIGDLNYFIGRIYKNNDQRVKYRNCDADKNEIILHEDKIQWDADIYLVEGAIDCIYYPNSIALMGKVLNNKMCLYKKLRDKSNANIVICLDGDTTLSEIKSVYKTLNNGRLYGKIRYIRFGDNDIPYKDFGELYENEEKNGIIRAMKQQKAFMDFEL
jgi:DNA primase